MIPKFITRIFHSKKVLWYERYFVGIVIAGAAVVTMACLAIGLGQSVWFDEAYSILLAKQPLTQTIYLASVDTHPPLYYVLLKLWATFFGYSEFALRSLSALAAGGAVVFAGLLVRRLFGVRVALIALLFVILAPFLLRYGFEIRMYSLASLIGIAATYVLVLAWQENKQYKSWALFALYAVLVAVGVYILYYTVLLWVAHLLWLAWMTVRAKKSFITAAWLYAYGVSVVLFLPWLPTFIQQSNNGALAPIAEPMTFNNLVGIVSFNFLYQPIWQLQVVTSIVMIFVLVAVSYFVIGAFKIVSAVQKPYLVLLVLYMLVPVVLLILISLLRPMYVERYLAHVAIGLMILVGVSVGLVIKQSSTAVKIVATMLGVILVIGVSTVVERGNYNYQRLQTPDVASASQEISNCSNEFAVIAADPYVAIELLYYLPDCDIRFYSESVKLGGGYAVLSESPLRVDNPVATIDAKTIYYVYYDKPHLELPPAFRQTTYSSYGPLTVSKFSVE